MLLLGFVISDKYKKQYRIVASNNDLGDLKRVYILSGNARIGNVNYHFAGSEVLYLDDLHIRQDAILFPAYWWDVIVAKIYLPSLQWQTHNFQGRGIGTAMIEFLAEYARSMGAKRIEGHIKSNDLKINPDLPNWYLRRGFKMEGNKISRSL